MDKVKFPKWTPARLIKEYQRRSKSPLIQTSALAKDILNAIKGLGTEDRMKNVWEDLFKKDPDGLHDEFVDSVIQAVERAFCLTDMAVNDLDTPAKQRDKLLAIAKQVEVLEQSLLGDSTAYKIGMGTVRRAVDERWLSERNLLNEVIDLRTGESSLAMFKDDRVQSSFLEDWMKYQHNQNESAEPLVWHAWASRRLCVEEVLDRLKLDLQNAALQLDRPKKDLVKNLIRELNEVIQFHLGKSCAKEIADICWIIDGGEWIDPKHIPRNY